MLSLRLLFFAISIFGLINANQYRRYNEIDVKVVRENDKTFESKMHDVLQTAEIFFIKHVAGGILNITGNLSQEQPDYMSLVSQLLSFVKGIVSIDNEVIRELVKEIPIEIERSNVQQDIVNMESKVKTILFNIDYLNGSADIQSEIKQSIVHDMHNDLFEMVNVFDHHHSNFKKHPLVAAPLLFSIAPLIALYNRIEDSLNPQLAKKSIIGCKIQEVLKEYQPLTTIDRLTKIQITTTHVPPNGYGCNADLPVCGNLFRNVGDAMQLTFNETEDNVYFTCAVECDRPKEHFDDGWSSDCGYSSNNAEHLNRCITDLMVYVKHYLARQFNATINVLNDACPQQKRTRQLHPSGFGWLTVNIFGASYGTPNHRDCDYFGLCELYVKVLANNDEICRTDFRPEKMSVDWFKTCISQKIPRTAKIVFELWDKDFKYDDLLQKWETNIDRAIEPKSFSDNVRVNAFWKDELLEDWE